jgi:hypothetical protein
MDSKILEFDPTVIGVELLTIWILEALLVT